MAKLPKDHIDKWAEEQGFIEKSKRFAALFYCT